MDEKTIQTEVKTGFTPQGGLVPQSFDQLLRLSNIMHSSGLMPTSLKTVSAVFVAVQMGLEVGLSPMQAVQNIAVINGRPCVWGDAALALIKNSPFWIEENFEECFEGTFPKDNFKAICKMQRKGGKVKTVEFSIEDAKRAGLWNKPGPWTTYPQRMLQMRARAWPARDLFPDVLKGLKLAEEIIDIEPIETMVEATGQQQSEVFNNVANEEIENQFDEKIKIESVDQAVLNKYLELCADHNKTSIMQVKIEAMNDYESFISGLKRFNEKRKVTPEVKPVEPEPEQDLFMNWTGFSQKYFNTINTIDQMEGFLSTNEPGKIKDFPTPFIAQIEKKYKALTGKELFGEQPLELQQKEQNKEQSVTLTSDQENLKAASEFVDLTKLATELHIHRDIVRRIINKEWQKISTSVCINLIKHANEIIDKKGSLNG